MIITGASDTFFSVGFDFNELLKSNDPKIIKEQVTGLVSVLKRLLTFPLPTIAAINGHCYAGGVFIAMACDWRIMLNDCGDFCLSEVHLGLSIPQ